MGFKEALFGGWRSGRRLEVIHPGHVEFVGEQDGEVEKELKQALTPVLSKYQVQRAYLTQVRLGKDPAINVALCLVASTNRKLVREVVDVFRIRFSSETHLDILFFDRRTSEKNIIGVCEPFYVS